MHQVDPLVENNPAHSFSIEGESGCVESRKSRRRN
jgi:hypothetical protein